MEKFIELFAEALERATIRNGVPSPICRSSL